MAAVQNFPCHVISMSFDVINSFREPQHKICPPRFIVVALMLLQLRRGDCAPTTRLRNSKKPILYRVKPFGSPIRIKSIQIPFQHFLKHIE